MPKTVSHFILLGFIGGRETTLHVATFMQVYARKREDYAAEE